MWEVSEPDLKLIRHVRVWRHEMLDPRIKLANKSPVPITGKWSRLTGERVTFKQYKDGSMRDENFPEIEEHEAKRPQGMARTSGIRIETQSTTEACAEVCTASI